MRIIIDCPWYIRTCAVPMVSGGIDFQFFFLIVHFCLPSKCWISAALCFWLGWGIYKWSSVIVTWLYWWWWCRWWWWLIVVLSAKMHDYYSVRESMLNAVFQPSWHRKAWCYHRVNSMTVKMGKLRPRGDTWLDLGHSVGKKQSFPQTISMRHTRKPCSLIKV